MASVATRGVRTFSSSAAVAAQNYVFLGAPGVGKGTFAVSVWRRNFVEALRLAAARVGAGHPRHR